VSSKSLGSKPGKRPGPSVVTVDIGRKGDPFSAELGSYLSRTGTSTAQLGKALEPFRSRVPWLEAALAGKHLVHDENWETVLRWLAEQNDPELKRRWVLADIRTRLRQPRPSPRRPVSARPGPAVPVNLVGIGALNYDCVIPVSEYVKAFGGKRPIEMPVTPDHERKVATYAQLQQVADELVRAYQKPAATLFRPSLGGSAFNAIHVLARSCPGLRLAMVGLGGVPISLYRDDRTHKETLENLDVNCRYLWPSGRQGGACVSVLLPKDPTEASRGMATCEENTGDLSGLLVEDFWELAELIVVSGAVYLTSIFDDASAEILADLLEYCVGVRAGLQVFFDPGYAWASGREVQDDVMRRLLACTTTLLATQPEFDMMLARHATVSLADDAAARLFGSSRATTTVVVKGKGVTAIHVPGARPVATRLDGPFAHVEDDTGAGDMFGAGYAATVLRGLGPRHAAQVGMRLARSKLAAVGPPPRAVAEEILRSPSREDATGR
jgi:sugar/nucleoside kinase (ribokinase family)